MSKGFLVSREGTGMVRTFRTQMLSTIGGLGKISHFYQYGLASGI